MFAAPLRTASVLASAIVVLSFVLFAVDEVGDASERTTAAIAGLDATRTADPSPDQERAREAAHGTVRELIDDANDVLVAPFAALAPDDGSSWVTRGVPLLLALLVYGFGLSFLARLVSGRV